MGEGVGVAVDTMGRPGGGMYSVDEKCEGTNEKVVGVLKGLRADGTGDRIWTQTVQEFERIRGGESIKL